MEIKQWCLSSRENGFSLIDVVITLAIIIALSIGGFMAYSGLKDRAIQASVDAAAKQVYDSSHVYNTTDSSVEFQALREYNENSSSIRATIVYPDGSKYTTCDTDKWPDPTDGTVCV